MKHCILVFLLSILLCAMLFPCTAYAAADNHFDGKISGVRYESIPQKSFALSENTFSEALETILPVLAGTLLAVCLVFAFVSLGRMIYVNRSKRKESKEHPERSQTAEASVPAADSGCTAEKADLPFRKNRKPITVLFAALVSIAALGAVFAFFQVCNYALHTKPQIMKSATSPTDAVNAYFTNLRAREFAEADQLLSSELMTLAESPNSEVGILLYDAMWENFSYSCTEPAVIDGLNAVQTVSVTYLDIPAVTALQRTHMLAALEQLAREYEDPSVLLDDEGYYNTDISLEALADVTERLLKAPERFLVTKEFTLELEYVNYNWVIHTNEDLYAILSGNTY